MTALKEKRALEALERLGLKELTQGDYTMNSKIFTNDFLAIYFEKKRWLYLNGISFEDKDWDKEWDEKNREATAKALEDVFNLRLAVDILENLPTDPAKLDSSDYDFLAQAAIRYYESLVD